MSGHARRVLSRYGSDILSSAFQASLRGGPFNACLSFLEIVQNAFLILRHTDKLLDKALDFHQIWGLLILIPQ